MTYDISTPTFQLVLEKQRREAQLSSTPRHEPDQVSEALIRIRRIHRLSALDAATPEDHFIGSRDQRREWR